jgi:hypothetical protein
MLVFFKQIEINNQTLIFQYHAISNFKLFLDQFKLNFAPKFEIILPILHNET